MKTNTTLILLCSVVMSFMLRAQGFADTTNEKSEPVHVLVCDPIPEFPGGEKELVNFLIRNTQYPDSARVHQAEGKVMIGFVVMEEGSVDSIRVVRAVHPALDAEAKRVSGLLHFKPAMLQGKPVKTHFVLPFRFYLH